MFAVADEARGDSDAAQMTALGQRREFVTF